MRQLKYALQLLALPVTAQVRLDMDDWGRVERLRKYFQDGRCQAHCQMNGRLTPAQKAGLQRIDQLLWHMNPGPTCFTWPEERLRQNADWRRVRASARSALILFDWPLDLPIQEDARHASSHHTAVCQPRPFRQPVPL